MNERQFLQELERRAEEQEKIMQGIPFPHIFTAVSLWLGNHPWRILIPVAFVLTMLCQALWGGHYDDFVLRVLGGHR